MQPSVRKPIFEVNKIPDRLSEIWTKIASKYRPNARET